MVKLTRRCLSLDDSEQIRARQREVGPVQPGAAGQWLAHLRVEGLRLVLLQLKGREWSSVGVCHTYP